MASATAGSAAAMSQGIRIWPRYAGLHQGGLIMLAGSDLVMTMLTVAYLAGLDTTKGIP